MIATLLQSVLCCTEIIKHIPDVCLLTIKIVSSVSFSDKDGKPDSWFLFDL